MRKILSVKSLAYIYLVLPVILFFAGWAKILYAVILSGVIVYCVYSALKEDDRSTLVLNWKQQILPLLLMLVLVIWAGIGNYVFQNNDHAWRNALMNILVDYDWPVVYHDGEEPRVLIYYIGFWLPSALIGKILGGDAGYLFMVLWATLGVSLTWYLLCRALKVFSIWVLIAFLFFSGLDIVGQIIVIKEPLLLGKHLEPWIFSFQYSSFTTQLFWVFNQAIPAWVLFLLLMQSRSNRGIIFLWSLGLLQCTFPFVGMFPFLIYVTWKNSEEEGEKFTKWSEKCAKWIKSLLTFDNIVGGGLIGILSALYLTGNDAGQKFGFCRPSLHYLVFIFIEIGVYIPFILKYQRNALVCLTLGVLLIVPLITVGKDDDFCMRASIPALVMLFLLVAQSWRMALQHKSKLFLTALSVVFIIGAITPLHEFYRTAERTAVTMIEEKKMYENETFSDDNILGKDIYKSNNFSGYMGNSLFFRYIGRQ